MRTLIILSGLTFGLMISLEAQIFPTAIEIDSMASHGLVVHHTDSTGLIIQSAMQDGIQIGQTADDGIFIDRAGDYGILIFQSNSDGINIGQTGAAGIQVASAGNPSTLEIPDVFSNGFMVLGSEDHGLFVGRADDDGVRIKSAGIDGVHIESAGRFGISASGTQAAGYFDGNVGIGKEQPNFPLTIHKTGNAMTGNNVDISELSLVLNKGENLNTQAIGMGFQSSGDDENIGAAIIHQRTGLASKGKLHFATKTGTSNGQNIPIHMTIDDQGEVGIGTKTPQASLDIARGSSSGLLLDNAGDLLWRNSTGLIKPVLSLHSDNNVYLDATSNTTSDLIFRTNTSLDEQMVITQDGDVGVGTSAPQAKLDVDGTIRTNGEINRPATGSANLLPICFGVVERDGTIRSGSGNFSVSIHPSSSKIFNVQIDDVDFDIDNHVALVSAYGVSGANATYEQSETGSGELVVITDAGLGLSAAFAFSFIVYEP